MMETINTQILKFYTLGMSLSQSARRNLHSKIEARMEGVTFMETVAYVAMFIVPLAILFWLFQGQIVGYFNDHVWCRFSGGGCANDAKSISDLCKSSGSTNCS